MVALCSELFAARTAIAFDDTTKEHINQPWSIDKKQKQVTINKRDLPEHSKWNKTFPPVTFSKNCSTQLYDDVGAENDEAPDLLLSSCRFSPGIFFNRLSLFRGFFFNKQGTQEVENVNFITYIRNAGDSNSILIWFTSPTVRSGRKKTMFSPPTSVKVEKGHGGGRTLEDFWKESKEN